MSDRRALWGAAVAEEQPGAGGSAANLVAAMLVVLTGGLGALVLLSGAVSDLVILALIGILSAGGIFFGIGYATGHVRIGEMPRESQLHSVIADTISDGIRVCERDGREVYTNRAFTALVGRNGAGATNTLEEAFAGGHDAAEALYRLALAASCGDSRQEEFSARSAGARPGETRWYRLSVKPLVRNGQPVAAASQVIWQLADITAERTRAAAEVGGVASMLARYDDVPIGMLIANADGVIEHMNASLLRWLGLPAVTRGRALRLADFVPEDGRAVLATLSRSGSSETGRIDIDLIRADGCSLPACLVVSARPAASGAVPAGLAVAVIERRMTDLAAGGDGRPAQLRSARLFQSAPFGIATVGADGRILSANSAFSRLLLRAASVQGLPAIELLAHDSDDDGRAEVATALAAALAGKAAIPPASITVGQNREFTRRVLASALPRAEANPEAVMLCIMDATEQKALELKYAQSQKMEAVGKLAGGIAHDFNNILTGIIGFSDLLVQTHRPTDPAFKNIMAIKSAADRAAGTVSQLLAFSRRQTLQPKVLQLGDLLSDLSMLLNRLLGEKIDLKIHEGRDLWYVKADKNQFEQVIINLAVNARDAMMPKGGRLTIRTKNVSERDSQKLSHQGMAVGEYVLVEVEDTGSGMSPEIMAKIFEPFFTTKGILKGTGLGLSTVYGIVKQTGGFVFPESTVGKGTTFRVYLPAHTMSEAEAEEVVVVGKPVKQQATADLTGSGRVLVVEDEDFVRSFALEALKRQGYEVVTASTGLKGLEVFDANEGRFDLVLTDVIMPELDGPTLSRELHQRNPNLKIVFMSGYADDAFKNTLDPDTVFEFLPKPFSLAQLAAKVKEVIGR